MQRATTLPKPPLSSIGESGKKQVNIHLSERGRKYLVALQERFGLSQGGVIELILRERVREEMQADPSFDPEKRKLGGR